MYCRREGNGGWDCKRQKPATDDLKPTIKILNLSRMRQCYPYSLALNTVAMRCLVAYPSGYVSLHRVKRKEFIEVTMMR